MRCLCSASCAVWPRSRFAVSARGLQAANWGSMSRLLPSLWAQHSLTCERRDRGPPRTRSATAGPSCPTSTLGTAVRGTRLLALSSLRFASTLVVCEVTVSFVPASDWGGAADASRRTARERPGSLSEPRRIGVFGVTALQRARRTGFQQMSGGGVFFPAAGTVSALRSGVVGGRPRAVATWALVRRQRHKGYQS